MELNFDGASISTGGGNYLEVGNHKVKVSEVKKGNSSKQGTPFVQITVVDEDGSACAQDYYLTTEIKPGKKQSAWQISAAAILTIVAAVLNCDEATAKTKLIGMNSDNIDVKLSSLLVGKPFAINLTGKWVNPTDMDKPSWVKSEFGSRLFAVPISRMSELSSKKYIKADPAKDNRAANSGSSNSSSPVTETASAASSWED